MTIYGSNNNTDIDIDKYGAHRNGAHAGFIRQRLSHGIRGAPVRPGGERPRGLSSGRRVRPFARTPNALGTRGRMPVRLQRRLPRRPVKRSRHPHRPADRPPRARSRPAGDRRAPDRLSVSARVQRSPRMLGALRRRQPRPGLAPANGPGGPGRPDRRRGPLSPDPLRGGRPARRARAPLRRSQRPRPGCALAICRDRRRGLFPRRSGRSSRGAWSCR